MWTRKASPDAKEVDVRVILRGPLGAETSAMLTLDTGSPFSILNVELANKIDLTEDRSDGPSRLWGPTGADDGYRIWAAAITTMGKTIRDFPIRCHHIAPGANVDGVIGLDIIRRGRLIFDLPDGYVEFSWKCSDL